MRLALALPPARLHRLRVLYRLVVAELSVLRHLYTYNKAALVFKHSQANGKRTIQPLLGPTVHPYALDNIMPQDMGDLPNVLRALFVPLGICRGGLGDIGPNFLAKGYVE